MKGAYIISDDVKPDGDGIRVTIENGKFICEVSDGGGDYGGTWFCDIELLRYHIERYKEVLTKQNTGCILNM